MPSIDTRVTPNSPIKARSVYLDTDAVLNSWHIATAFDGAQDSIRFRRPDNRSFLISMSTVHSPVLGLSECADV